MMFTLLGFLFENFPPFTHEQKKFSLSNIHHLHIMYFVPSDRCSLTLLIYIYNKMKIKIPGRESLPYFAATGLPFRRCHVHLALAHLLHGHRIGLGTDQWLLPKQGRIKRMPFNRPCIIVCM